MSPTSWTSSPTEVRRFLKYARDNDSQGKASRISKLLRGTQEIIKDQQLDIDLSFEVVNGKPIPVDKLTIFGEIKEGIRSSSILRIQTTVGTLFRRI